MRNRIRLLLVLAVTLIAGIAPVAAQDAALDNPLLEMLALVPNIPPSRESLSYVNYRALFQSRPGAPLLTSAEDFDRIMAERSDQRALLTSTFQGISAGPYWYSSTYPYADEMPEMVGFHLFDIEQAIEFQNNIAVILKGNFENAAVTAALLRRGYTQSDLEGLTLLCPEGDCENGWLADRQQPNHANPFGGSLGRNEVVLLGDGWIASSRDIDIVTSIALIRSKLADAADYRAAAEAISAEGTVVQVKFVHPSDHAVWEYSLLDPRAILRDRQAAVAAAREIFVPIHSYYLLALAHTTTESEDRGIAALVYLRQDSAEYTAPILLERLNTFREFGSNRIWSEALAAYGVTATDAEIFPASTNRTVAMVIFHGVPPSSDVPSTMIAETQGRALRLLIRASQGFGLNWLTSAQEVPD
jgi:hypothetical protein